MDSYPVDLQRLGKMFSAFRADVASCKVEFGQCLGSVQFIHSMNSGHDEISFYLIDLQGITEITGACSPYPVPSKIQLC